MICITTGASIPNISTHRNHQQKRNKLNNLATSLTPLLMNLNWISVYCPYIKWLQIHCITKWHIKKTYDFKDVCLYETVKVSFNVKAKFWWESSSCASLKCNSLFCRVACNWPYSHECSRQFTPRWDSCCQCPVQSWNTQAIALIGDKQYHHQPVSPWYQKSVLKYLLHKTWSCLIV